MMISTLPFSIYFVICSGILCCLSHRATVNGMCQGPRQADSLAIPLPISALSERGIRGSSPMPLCPHLWGHKSKSHEGNTCRVVKAAELVGVVLWLPRSHSDSKTPSSGDAAGSGASAKPFLRKSLRKECPLPAMGTARDGPEAGLLQLVTPTSLSLGCQATGSVG